ncbi:MAG: DUF1731 domain-containing protein [Planctomycetota bacterium]
MALSLAFVAVAGFARNNPYDKSLPKSPKAQYRDVCANSESQIDQSINNVRARLLGGGDCWWDFNDGRYVVPKRLAEEGFRFQFPDLESALKELHDKSHG